MPHSSNLPNIKRLVTTHDKNGKAIFTQGSLSSEAVPWEPIDDGTKAFGLAYTTSSAPAKLQGDKDIAQYEQYLENKPGLTIPGGTVLRYVDYGPSVTSPVHRTMSLDYGVVVEGEIELLLDSGESRLMKRGDISIVRTTKHGWHNPSKDQWCRVLFVLLDAEPPVVNGKTLGDNYGDAMPGVKASRGGVGLLLEDLGMRSSLYSYNLRPGSNQVSKHFV
jgi:quercetin dioxygenase-like cupin family protein